MFPPMSKASGWLLPLPVLLLAVFLMPCVRLSAKNCAVLHVSQKPCLQIAALTMSPVAYTAIWNGLLPSQGLTVHHFDPLGSSGLASPSEAWEESCTDAPKACTRGGQAKTNTRYKAADISRYRIL